MLVQCWRVGGFGRQGKARLIVDAWLAFIYQAPVFRLNADGLAEKGEGGKHGEVPTCCHLVIQHRYRGVNGRVAGPAMCVGVVAIYL